MGNRNQIHGPLPDVLPMEISNAPLGDDIMDISSHETHACPHIQGRYDSRDLPVFGGGLEGQNGLPFRRQHGAAHEISLSADTAVEPPADRFGCGLACQIDLQGTVDGSHSLVPGDHQRVIGIIDGPELNAGVVMDGIIGLRFPHAEGGDALPAVDVLLAVIDNPGLHQCHDAVGQQLGMNAQVLFAAKIGQDGVWKASIPDLNGIPVFDQL
jgi:hypothetical protein